MNFDDLEDENQPDDFSDRYGIILHTTFKYRNWAHKQELRPVFWDYDDEPNFEMGCLLTQTMKTFLHTAVQRQLKILPKYAVSVDVFFLESEQDGDEYDDEEAEEEGDELDNTPRDLMETQIHLHFDGAYFGDVARLIDSQRFEVDAFYAMAAFLKTYFRSQDLAENCVLIQHEVEGFSD